MYPHERSLVKKWKDAPFALLGINSDPNLPYLQARLRQERITWRSFWNGPLGTLGPIASRWGVTSWPTIYLLDAKGVIRFVNTRGDELDAALEQLLAEARQGR